MMAAFGCVSVASECVLKSTDAWKRGFGEVSAVYGVGKSMALAKYVAYRLVEDGKLFEVICGNRE